MKVTYITRSRIDIGNADGIQVYQGEAGETVDVPADVATMLIEQGLAQASRTKPETAAKPRPKKEA